MALLKPEDVNEQLKTLDGWTLDGKAIRKQYTFQDFPEAVLFVSALVPGAEDADHHPDIEIHYKRVVLSYSTHDEGGLTAKDFDGAAVGAALAANQPQLEEFGVGEKRYPALCRNTPTMPSMLPPRNRRLFDTRRSDSFTQS